MSQVMAAKTGQSGNSAFEMTLCPFSHWFIFFEYGYAAS